MLRVAEKSPSEIEIDVFELKAHLSQAREIVKDLLFMLERAKREGSNSIRSMHYIHTKLQAKTLFDILGSEFCESSDAKID